MRRSRAWLPALMTIGLEVILPLSAYYVLRAVGIGALTALAASTSVSGVLAGIQVTRERRIRVITALALVGMAISLLGGLLTRDPVVLYLRDPATGAAIAILAFLGLIRGRPLVRAIRRDLAPDPTRFDVRWASDPAFRRAHARASIWWALGLLTLAVVSTLLVIALPLDSAVGISQVLGAVTYLSLITASEATIRTARSSV